MLPKVTMAKDFHKPEGSIPNRDTCTGNFFYWKMSMSWDV